MKKAAITLHGILVLLELVALFHDFQAFGLSMFKWYTIDSNILQLVISLILVIYLLRGKEIPAMAQVFHLICAVCLTITFFIALLVLAPQDGFDYYFLQDVAPINHALGPALSLVTFIFFCNEKKLPGLAFLAPMAASLLYGGIALVLNVLNLLVGPYFFLEIHTQPLSVVGTWFGIICVLCLVLSALFLWLRSLAGRKR